MIALDTGWHYGDTTTPRATQPFPSPSPNHPHLPSTSFPPFLPPLLLPPPQDVVPAPVDRSLAPGDRRVPSACWSCRKQRCPKVQSALASLSAILHPSAKLFVNHDVCFCVSVCTHCILMNIFAPTPLSHRVTHARASTHTYTRTRTDAQEPFSLRSISNIYLDAEFLLTFCFWCALVNTDDCFVVCVCIDVSLKGCAHYMYTKI